MIPTQFSWRNVKPVLVRYWFQLSLGAIVLFVILHRDLSFQLSVKAPIDTQVMPTDAKSKSALAKNKLQNGVLQASTETSLVPSISAHNTYTDDIPASAKQSFVRRFLSSAQKESEKYHIPVSIILAQGI